MGMFRDLDDGNPLPPSVSAQRRATIARGRWLQRRRQAVAGMAVAVVGLLTLTLWALPSITASPSPVRPGPSVPVTPLSVVVLADSFVSTDHCPGCRTFAAQYAATLAQRSGRPVTTTMPSHDGHWGVRDILKDLSGDTPLQRAVSSADVVVLSIGFNDAIPDLMIVTPGGPFPGCRGRVPDAPGWYVGHTLATTPACTGKAVRAWAEYYDRILTTVATLRRGRPTTVIAMTSVDGNLGNSRVRADLSPEQFATFERVLVDAYNQWNDAICQRAAAHQAACADTYHAANGPRGDRPPTLYMEAPRYYPEQNAYLTQAGMDLWASVLAGVDTSMVTG